MRMSVNLVMKLGLSWLAILLFLCSGASVLGSVVSKGYHYSTDHKTWWEAQAHCRSSHTDLATIYTQSDSDGLNMENYFAWVGLNRDQGKWDWEWSSGHSSFIPPWASVYEPIHGGERCAMIRQSNQKLYSNRCDSYLFFYCFKHDNEYIFIPESKRWSKAKDYCKDNYDHLGFFYDIYGLQNIIKKDFPVWTGLYKDGQEWKWSRGTSSDYRKWASNQPGNNGDCVTISSLTKQMAARDCNARYPFVCYRDNVVLVKEKKTWEQALEHCRQLQLLGKSDFDLLSVEPADHSHLMNRMTAGDVEKVWVGLRFLASEWLWVNGAGLQYDHLPGCPVDGKHCAAFTSEGTGGVETTDCMEELSFLCYRP